MTFTRNELIEIARALQLVTLEDNDAGVNTDRASVAAKTSAAQKVQALLKEKR
jgi:hypothetical protein